MGSINLSSNGCLGELGTKAVKLEQDSVRGYLQQNEYPKTFVASSEESKSIVWRHGTDKSMSASLNAPNIGARVVSQDRSPVDDSGLCSTSSISPAPICRQFWRAGSYNDRLSYKLTSQNGTGHLHVHPKFLHSNATSHKWAFGAMAELIDNAFDEIQHGATFVIVDKTTNPRDGTSALLIQDDGGGMTPEAMRRCIGFGFSEKSSKNSIGQYGNGFKTSSMRLGADVIVFSRSMRDRKLTQSVGLLSYTFLMQTGQQRIVVPMVDYEFNVQSGKWVPLHNEKHHDNNLSILLRWSPVTTADELLKQCEDVGDHGSRIMIYNLWHNDERKLELDFESDRHDIRLSKSNNNANNAISKGGNIAKVSRREVNEQHLANRILYSLRAYLSILYLQIPSNFCIILRGQLVEYHSIANDLKYPEFILYKPLNVEGSVLTTIGFLKEAPAVAIHGFNVYHKNRLILPFWHVVTYSRSRGRGVVGVLEANFVEPTHNKQDFEKTPIFQKLEGRLKEMTVEYWDYHCGLLGYTVQKKPQPMSCSYTPAISRQPNDIYQPVKLVKDASFAIGAKTPSAVGSGQHKISASSNTVDDKSRIPVPSLQEYSHVPKRVKRMGVTVSSAHSVHNGVLQHTIDPTKQIGTQEASSVILENKKLKRLSEEYENLDKELNFKVTCLTEEVEEARREYACLLLESKLLERVKSENSGQ